MDKGILKDYTDACALIRETEAEIRRLNRKKKTVVQTNVKGSNPEYPYQPQHFKVQGTTFTYEEDSHLRFDEKLLEQQKEKAEELKRQVEQWMLTVPIRMQRIIRLKYFDNLSWDEVAVRLKRKATADSVRKELENFMKEK